MQLHFRRAVSALLALALLASSPALALGFIFGEGTDAPAASAIEDDGMLRVYLKSLGRPGLAGDDAGRLLHRGGRPRLPL